MVTTRSLALGDTELVWEEQGEGTPVVFVHGAIVDRRVWRHQRDEFANRYRFVAYDQRHHGESSRGAAAGPYSLAQHAEDLQALLRAIGGGPAHVVGFSYGANVVLTALLAAPELVSKTVLVEPALDTVLPRDAVSHEAIAPRNETLKAVGAEPQRGDDAAAMRLLAEWTDNGHTAGWEAADPHYLAMLGSKRGNATDAVRCSARRPHRLREAPEGEGRDAGHQWVGNSTVLFAGGQTRGRLYSGGRKRHPWWRIA